MAQTKQIYAVESNKGGKFAPVSTFGSKVVAFRALRSRVEFRFLCGGTHKYRVRAYNRVPGAVAPLPPPAAPETATAETATPVV